jgi:hypothetical protein
MVDADIQPWLFEVEPYEGKALAIIWGDLDGEIV